MVAVLPKSSVTLRTRIRAVHAKDCPVVRKRISCSVGKWALHIHSSNSSENSKPNPQI